MCRFELTRFHETRGQLPFFLFSLGIVPALMLTSPVRGNDGVTVAVDAFPTSPTIHTFDPTKPPSTPADPTRPGDLPGPPADLKPGEAGDAGTKVDLNGNFRTQIDPVTGKDTVVSVNVTVSVTEEVRLPSNANQALKDHEIEGHVALDRAEHTKSVETKVANALRRFVGATADFDDLQIAFDYRLERATRAIEKQLGTLGDKYDKLTNHGKNDKGFNTQTGRDEALKERNRPPFGWDPPPSFFDDLLKPWASINGASVFPGAEPGLLRFGGNMLFDAARDPTDILLGFGEVRIEPVVWIGLQEHGTIQLSDTELQVINPANGDILMDAFLFDLAYQPSSVPGFAGMIQAHLDIPPLSVGGINNTISSDFLAGIGAASEADELTTFWFYSQQPLFDTDGSPLIGSEGVDGSIKIGVATPMPEPASVLLLIAGLSSVTAAFRITGRHRDAGSALHT